MNIKQLQQGLDYCGRVEAVRQTYHVFQAKDSYLVLSFARAKDRKGSGYFNLIDEAAVDYVQGRMGGHSGVTAKDVVHAGRRYEAHHRAAAGAEHPVRDGRAEPGLDSEGR